MKKAYTKQIEDMSGYKTFVSPESTDSSKLQILPIRQEDDEESHIINMAPTYDNKPSQSEEMGRKLYRTLGKPGDQYGTPWKKFPKRRTLTSSKEEELEMIPDKTEIYQEVLKESEGMTPEEMYEEALRLKEEQGEAWDAEDEETLETLRLVVQDMRFEGEEEDWGEDEEDWTEDLSEDQEILAYKRRSQRQHSHSRAERIKTWLAKGLLGRLKAKKKARKYRAKHKSQLKTTRNINKSKNRTRVGPKVKTRKTAGLSELDLERLRMHGI